MGFIEDRVLMNNKGYMPLHVMDSLWLKWMVLHLCGQVQFFFRKQFVHEHFHVLLEKTMATYVFLTIA
jgi:hypothetical protein